MKWSGGSMPLAPVSKAGRLVSALGWGFSAALVDIESFVEMAIS
jgi:hypothetical protein